MSEDDEAEPPPKYPNRIRHFRKKARLSLEDLAAKSQLTFQTLQRWEKKHPKLPVEKVGRLAEVLGVRASELLPYHVEIAPEEAYLLELYRQASEAERRAIIRSVKGLTARDDTPLPSRKSR